MTLNPGTRIGPYEVTAQIGVGGMGEVYRANDTNLKRQVAIKVLPESVAGDAERLARFQREAEVLAQLNHPNIAQIHGLERADGHIALVMELVEGPTVADRITQGAIPVDEALPIAKQIAEALEAAHEQGIIHRDLKPANVKVRNDGIVKVLDFGLAKAMEGAGSKDPGYAASQLPTITTPAMTQAGMILGTAAYMSPEQARGKAVDKRADIWAFGAVLFEMLSGSRAFAGEDVSQTLARVLEREPDYEALPATVPARVRQALRVCLQKDPRRRAHDMADVRLMLGGAFDAGETQHVAAARASGWRGAPLVMASLVAALAVALLSMGTAAYLYSRPSADSPVLRFEFTASGGVQLPDGAGMAFSPDGSRLVYQARDENGVSRLYVRTLDSFGARPIEGTDGATQPFFSPDGEWLAFFADGKLKKVPSGGGVAIELCDAPNPRGGSWDVDDTIVFTPDFPSAVFRVPAVGGTPVPVTSIAGSLERHNWPDLLPDGSAVLYSTTATGDWADGEIVAVALGTGDRRVLVRGAMYARYVSPGYLVYTRAGNLMAVRFDASRLEVTGDAVPVVEGIKQSMINGAAQFSVSASGALAYVPRSASEDLRSAVWVDTRGVATSIGAPPRPYGTVRLSPDQGRVVMSVGADTVTRDAWVFDVPRSVLTRLTSNGRVINPVWTPDGLRVTYWSREGNGALVSRASDGSGSEERLYANDAVNTIGTAPGGWSPDGQVLIFVLGDTNTGLDLWTFSSGQQSVAPLLRTERTETQPVLSPDGRWIAYASNSSGRFEVYVQDFPGLTAKWQISANGGTQPLWARDGRQLFYRDRDSMMAVAVETQPTFAPRAARELFAGSFVQGDGSYDIARDGRFLMIRQDQPAVVSAEARVVVGWREELQRRLPRN